MELVRPGRSVKKVSGLIRIADGWTYGVIKDRLSFAVGGGEGGDVLVLIDVVWPLQHLDQRTYGNRELEPETGLHVKAKVVA